MNATTELTSLPAKRPMQSSSVLGRWFSMAIVGVFLLSFVFLTIYPVIFAILGSFKTNFELLNSTRIFAKVWQWQNVLDAWNKANFARYTWNSVFLSVTSTVITLIVCSMGAYALARRTFPGRNLIMSVFAATMFISIGAITFRPLYDMMKAVELHKSLWAVVLIFVGTHLAFNILLLERFVRSIPKELDEAATIDGSGFFGIYWKIILPLLGPGLGVVGLFAFRESWNQYILPLIFTMSKPEMRPLTVGVIQLKYSANAAAEWPLMLAGSMLSMLPIIIVYFLTNKAFIAGLTNGSVKG